MVIFFNWNIWWNFLFLFNWSHLIVAELKITIKSFWKPSDISCYSWTLANVANDTYHISYFIFISRSLQLWILLVIIKTPWSFIITVLNFRVMFVWVNILVSLYWLLQALKRSVCIVLYLTWVIDIHVAQSKGINVTVAALYFIVFFFLSLLCLPSNTKPANVIIAAIRDQNMVKVPQADRAIKLEFFPFLPITFINASWIDINAFDITLGVIGVYSDLITFF